MRIWITRDLEGAGIQEWDIPDERVQIDGKTLTIIDPTDGVMLERLDYWAWHRTAEDALKYAVSWRDSQVVGLRKVATRLELLRFEGEGPAAKAA